MSVSPSSLAVSRWVSASTKARKTGHIPLFQKMIFFLWQKKWTFTQLVYVVRNNFKFKDQICCTSRTTSKKFPIKTIVINISIHCRVNNVECSTWKKVSDIVQIIFIQLVLFLIGQLRGYFIQDNHETKQNYRYGIIISSTIPEFIGRHHCCIRKELWNCADEFGGC